jgi:hypothetical protein
MYADSGLTFFRSGCRFVNTGLPFLTKARWMKRLEGLTSETPLLLTIVLDGLAMNLPAPVAEVGAALGPRRFPPALDLLVPAYGTGWFHSS